jgi:uncharacterized RDD family membrane protein YckC
VHVTQPPGYGPPPGYPPPGYPPPGYPPPGYPPPGYRPAWQPPPPALSPGGAPLADFGTRLLSWLIDAVLVSVVGLGVAVPLGFWFLSTRFSRLDALGPTPGLGQVFSAFFLPLLLVEASVIAFQLVCYYVYSVELMYRSGQTLGKRIMKIRIVPLDPAATLTRGMAAKRYLVEFVGGTLIPYFHYVDGLWQLWDKPFQQTLHDKVARTAVVKVSA